MVMDIAEDAILLCAIFAYDIIYTAVMILWYEYDHIWEIFPDKRNFRTQIFISVMILWMSLLKYGLLRTYIKWRSFCFRGVSGGQPIWNAAPRENRVRQNVSLCSTLYRIYRSWIRENNCGGFFTACFLVCLLYWCMFGIQCLLSPVKEWLWKNRAVKRSTPTLTQSFV